MTTLITEGDRLLSVGGRPTSLSKPSVPFTTWSGGGSVPLLGNNSISYAQLYRTQPWVGIAVNKLARQVARLPLKAYKRNSQGDKERVSTGRFAELLERPWERGSANDLKQAFAFPTLLHGNGLVRKVRNRAGQPPSSFIPLDWRFISPHCEDGAPIYVWETQQPDQPKYIAPEDVIHTAWWSPDGAIGVSPLQQLGVTIRLEDAAQRYSTASFDNAVRPSGALVAPADAKLNREERQELRDEVNASNGGVDRAFKLLLLTGGLDWKPFSQTAREAELVDQRKINREEIAAVYDVPPPLIGILDHATYSNVGEMHKMLYMTVLGPWLDLIESRIKAQLIDNEPAFANEGLFVEFDLSEVLKGDTRNRVLALKDGIGTGLYTLNEARRIENLPRIDNPLADQPLIPENNLKPLGSSVPSENTDPGEQTAATLIGTHLARARERVLANLGLERTDDPLERERFERELAADLTDRVGDAEATAKRWTELVDSGVMADLDPAAIKQFFSTLGVG